MVAEPERAGRIGMGALATEMGTSGSVRVLLVEDDARSAMLLAEMLRAAWRRGLVLVHTLCLEEAAQELLDHGADCVLLHPAGDRPAADAVAQLATAAPDTPVIVIGRDDEDLAAVRAGAQDVLALDDVSATLLRRAVGYAVERKRSEVELARQALRDPLTELPNRALFIDRLRGALDRTRRTGSPVVVLFLDVDDFKAINDTRGHAAGDRLMTLLADRFSALLRPMDTVARFGGDEFTFLFEGLGGAAEAAEIAERIRLAAAAPIVLDGEEVTITVSVGVTVVTDPRTSVEEILRRADSAMYRAKGRGGSGFELFAAVPLPDAGELEHELRHAVERAQLRVHYQPRVSLEGDTGLVGFEALVRWQHPEHGLMEPAEFIGLAEQTGLIGSIGDWVLGQALRQVEAWRRARPGVTISVNLSPRQLTDPALPERLAETIREGGHDPSVLCLEVPEGALEAEPELACRQLAALNELGVTLAVDDFGTGAAASHLERMPIHILKIDRTLVSALGGEVREAVRLGHELGLSVVAEGVETDNQLARLRELGCDGAQGYLFSEPMPEERVLSALGGA